MPITFPGGALTSNPLIQDRAVSKRPASSRTFGVGDGRTITVYSEEDAGIEIFDGKLVHVIPLKKIVTLSGQAFKKEDIEVLLNAKPEEYRYGWRKDGLLVVFPLLRASGRKEGGDNQNVHRHVGFEKEELHVAKHIETKTGLYCHYNTRQGRDGAGRQGDTYALQGQPTRLDEDKYPEGRKVEFKSLNSCGPNTIKSRVGKSLRDGGQAPHIVVDARPRPEGVGKRQIQPYIPYTEEQAIQQLKRFDHPALNRGRLKSLTIIGPGYIVTRSYDAEGGRSSTLADELAKQSQEKNLKENAQQANLEETLSGTCPSRPIAEHGGGGGAIGGVGMEVGQITGLRNSLCDVFDKDPIFLMKSPDGKPPFSDSELQQILRELAQGIFAHDSRPIFSLHFNSNGTLYPVIPPEYANTLVGHVMGMLDYIMKGYLNGGIFQEKFIREWEKNPNQNTASAIDRLIDLKNYCASHVSGMEYFSLRERMLAEGLATSGNQAEKYRSSFRIIANNPIMHTENRFEIGSRFRVDFTLEASPRREEQIRLHRLQHGCDPVDHQKLEEVYETMARDIENNLPKLPMCRDYFQMLGVIQFFSYYFSTLKEMEKIPSLDPITVKPLGHFPKLLPPLPIRQINPSKEVNLDDVVKRLSGKNRQELDKFLGEGGSKRGKRQRGNPNSQRKDGMAALHLASKNRHIEVVRALFEAGQQVNRLPRLAADETPLHLAAAVGDIGILKLLIHNRGVISAKSQDDKTKTERWRQAS